MGCTSFSRSIFLLLCFITWSVKQEPDKNPDHLNQVCCIRWETEHRQDNGRRELDSDTCGLQLRFISGEYHHLYLVLFSRQLKRNHKFTMQKIIFQLWPMLWMNGEELVSPTKLTGLCNLYRRHLWECRSDASAEFLGTDVIIGERNGRQRSHLRTSKLPHAYTLTQTQSQRDDNPACIWKGTLALVQKISTTLERRDGAARGRTSQRSNSVLLNLVTSVDGAESSASWISG